MPVAALAFPESEKTQDFIDKLAQRGVHLSDYPTTVALGVGSTLLQATANTLQNHPVYGDCGVSKVFRGFGLRVPAYILGTTALGGGIVLATNACLQSVKNIGISLNPTTDDSALSRSASFGKSMLWGGVGVTTAAVAMVQGNAGIENNLNGYRPLLKNNLLWGKTIPTIVKAIVRR